MANQARTIVAQAFSLDECARDGRSGSEDAQIFVELWAPARRAFYVSSLAMSRTSNPACRALVTKCSTWNT